MAELNIHVTTDGASQIGNLRQELSGATRSAETLSETMRAINRAAGGQELYFATTKARDGFLALVNEAAKLERQLSGNIKGTEKYNELAFRLGDVRDKVVDMASSAAMAGRLMSASFVKEVGDAAKAVSELEQKMVVAQANIDKIETKMAARSTTLAKSGGSYENDFVYKSLSSDLVSQKEVLRSTSEQLEENRTRLGSLQDAQRVFGRSTVQTSTELETFVQKLNQIPVVGQATTGVFSQMRRAMGDVSFALLGGLGFEQLGARIFSTRSMMQKLEISFETMLQSADKAQTLMGQLVETAAKTPFGIMDVTNGAKQLLAYGTAADKVNETLVRLGDISAGLGVPLGDLVYLYGTTMAQGRMFTQDLRQFMGRGIPMAEELGKILKAQGKVKTGSMAEVQDLVTKGKIDSDLVRQAIEGMTSEGSRFGGLMERQSTTLQGQWANIGDTVDMMFNEMGKSTEGVFNGALSVVSEILDNWQSIVKVIGVAAAAVGTYKAGLMLSAAVQRQSQKEELSPLDGRIKELKERESDANDVVGYNVADNNTAKSRKELVKVVADSSVSNDIVEQTIKDYQTRGLINDELATELRQKREILMAQERITAQAEEEAANTKRNTASTGDGISKKASERDDIQKALEQKEKELTELDAKIAEQQKKVDIESVEKEYMDAYSKHKADKIRADKAEGNLNGLNDRITTQEDVVSQMRNDLGPAASFDAQYQSEVENLQKLRAERDKAKTEFLNACTQEEQSLARVNAAQEALGKSSKYDAEREELSQKKSILAANEEDLRVEEAKLAAIREEVKAQQEKINQFQGNENSSLSGYQDAFTEDDNIRLAELQQKEADALNARNEAARKVQESSQSLQETQSRVRDSLIELNEAADASAEATESVVSITEAGTAATEANITAENADAQAKKLGEMQTQRKALAAEKEAIATKLNTTQTELDSMWQDRDAAAKGRNGLASAALAVKTKLQTAANTAGVVAQRMYNAAVEECTIAMNNLKIALMSNPITAIFTILSTVGTGLYMMWDSISGLWKSDADKAKESVQTYTNSANEAMVKTQGLYAQMEASATGSKAHKNAIDELARTCEEYGIKLDETVMKGDSEYQKAKELEDAHLKLAQAIKEDAIQQEYLNSVRAAQDTYTAMADEASEDYASGRNGKLLDGGIGGDYFTEEQWSALKNVITDEDRRKLAEYKEEIENLNNALMDSSEVRKKYNAIEKEIDARRDAAVTKMMEQTGKQKDLNRALDNARRYGREYVESLVDAQVTMDKSVRTAEEAENAVKAANNELKGWSKEEQNAAYKARLAKQDTDALRESADKLIKEVGGKVIGIGVKFTTWMDNINVPKWMLAKSEKDLQKDLKGWLGILDKMNRTGAKSVYVKGHGNMSVEDVTAKAEQTNKALTQRTADDKSKAEKEAAEKKEKDKAAKKAAAQAKKDANDKSRRETATDNANKAYEKALTSYSEKSNETLLKSDTEAMEKGTAKEIQQIEDSTRKQLAAIEEQKKKLVEARKKQAQAVWVNAVKGRKQNEWKNTTEGKRTDAEWWAEISKTSAKDNDGKEITNSQGKSMTIGELYNEQKIDVDTQNAKKISKIYEEENKARLESMQDFLKQYGTYEEKRLAIAQEYAAKISKAQTEGERLSLTMQRNDAIEQLDAEQLKKSINWEDVFNNISYMTVEQLKGVKSQLQSMMSDGTLKVDEYKSAAEQIQKVNEAILTAEEKTKAAIGLILPHVRERKQLEQDVVDAINAQNSAAMAQSTANANLSLQRTQISDKLQGFGMNVSAGDIKSSNSQAIVNQVSAKYGADSKETKDIQSEFGKLVTSEQAVISANARRIKSEQQVINSQSKLATFTKDLGEKLKGAQEVMGLVNANVSSLPDLLGSLGVDSESSFGKGVQDIANATQSATSAISDFASGNFIGAAFNSVSAVKSLWSGMGNIFTGSGESDKTLDEDIRDLTNSNEALKNSIDALAEKMDDAESMSDITSYYEQQKKNLEQAQANTQEMMYRSADAHVAGNMFRSRKKGSYEHINQNMSDSDWKRVSEAAGVSINDARDFFKLTSEQMNEVATQLPDLYAKIKYYASTGYKDASQYMDTYIEYAQQLKELEEQYMQYMTNTSFDNVKSDFQSMLADMDSSTQDFAENFEETLRNAVINSMMTNTYSKRLEKWYESFSSKMADDGTLTSDEVKSLRGDYDQIVKDALAEREALMSTLGIDSYSQSASSGAYQTMSQDTGDELNGRFTAVQEATEGTWYQTQLINQKLAQMLGVNGTETLSEAEGSSVTGAISDYYRNGGDGMAVFDTMAATMQQGIMVADESRTILAQMQLSLASIDERQQGWEKPFKTMFSQIKDIRDDIHAKL